MINDYLENNIKNKLKIFTILYTKTVTSTTELIDNTQLSYKNVINLVTELNNDFQGIAEIQRCSSTLTFYVYEEVSLTDLLFSIYDTSNVLKCLKFLINNDDNQPFSDFADDNFLTLPTAYRIRQNCVQYLNVIGLHVERNQIIGAEYRIRFLIALLYYKCGIDCCGIDRESIMLARKFILYTNQTINMDFLEATTDEYGYFECLLILTWKRKKYPVTFVPPKDFDILKSFFSYAQLETKLHEFFTPPRD